MPGLDGQPPDSSATILSLPSGARLVQPVTALQTCSLVAPTMLEISRRDCHGRSSGA
jgi:hypothetical protein